MVNQRQCRGSESEFIGHGQDGYPMMTGCEFPPLFRRVLQIKLSLPVLHADLERADGRDKKRRGIFENHLPGLGRELSWRFREPERSASIEQQLHSNASGQSSGSRGLEGSS